MLNLTRKVGERIMIGDDIVLVVTHMGKNQVTFGIEAPAHVSIDREEIYLRKNADKNSGGDNKI